MVDQTGSMHLFYHIAGFDCHFIVKLDKPHSIVFGFREETMTDPSGSSFMSLFILPFFACTCGVGPLIFAVILFLNARRAGRLAGSLKNAQTPVISQLKSDMGLVRLAGAITNVPSPLYPQDPQPQAFLRLRVEAWKESASDDHMEWSPQTDKIKATPFQINDGTGSVWVLPEGLDKSFLGPGIDPSASQVENAALLLQVSPGAMMGRRLRYRLWEIRKDQRVTVVGTVVPQGNQMVIQKAKNQPLIIAPGEIAAISTEVSRQTNTSRVWALVLGIPGLIVLCGSLVWMTVSIVNLFISGS
jgi:hypothetical protein